jgi:hypothetical protein
VNLLCCISHCQVLHKIWNRRAFYFTFTIVQNVIQSGRTQDVKPLFTIFYSQDPQGKWNRCVEYCTVTTKAVCETAVHIIVLSQLTHYAKLLCWILHCHISHKIWNRRAIYFMFTIVQNVIQSRHTGWATFVHNNLLSRSAQKVKPLCRILYCHDLSTMWNLCTENCTVTTNTQCETFVHNRVLSRLTHALSEWLLLSVNSAIVHLYYGESKSIFNEMMMRSALFSTNMLSWIFIVLARRNNSPRVDMSLHSDTLFWFRANQSLVFLLNAACLARKQQIPIAYPLAWAERGSNPRSTALEVIVLTIPPSMPLHIRWNVGQHIVLSRLPHTMWNRCVECCIVPTHTQCKFVVHLIILSRDTHNVKPFYIKLYRHDSLTMLVLCEEYYTVRTYIRCESAWKNIVLSRHTQNVKTLFRTLSCHDLHTMWNHWAIDWCAIQINTFSESVEYWDAVINRDHKYINVCLSQ